MNHYEVGILALVRYHLSRFDSESLGEPDIAAAQILVDICKQYGLYQRYFAVRQLRRRIGDYIGN